MQPYLVYHMLQKYANVTLEVSGGIAVKNIASFANPGVDAISSGQITSSAPAINPEFRSVPLAYLTAYDTPDMVACSRAMIFAEILPTPSSEPVTSPLDTS